MGDQDIVKKYLESLKCCQERNNLHKCLELLEIIEEYFDGSLKISEINYALQLILSYGEGKISILKFLINTLSQGKGKFTPCVKKAFSIIQMLCKSYPEKVRKYAQDIVDISTIFINQEKVYATEKESAAQTIYEILNSEASSKGIKLEQVLETLMIFLGHKDLPERLQKHLYVICGLISKNHPKEVKEFQAKELRDLMINRIISLYKDDKAKPSLTAIGGAIEGLNYHLQNFTPSHDEDPEFGNKLYECMIWLTDTKKAEDFSRRESFRKMLELIYNFANIYDIPFKFFNQYSSWQETFKHWINSKLYDDTVAGVHAMQKFHELISTVIETRKDPDDKKVLNYFVRYFKATLQDQNSQPHEIRIAIKGFGAMAGACKILEETNYLSELFDLIMQQTEYSYFTNDRLKRREVLEHLPNYVQSLSRIMNHLKEITGIQLQSLQSIIVVLIKDFHFLSSSHHALVPISLMETFLNLQKLGGKVLSDVLEFVIWQGILWTCSHQLTYDLQENIEDMKDWKEMITYRKYLPLWSQLINSKREEYKEISKLIFNNFVKNLFEIIEHLDLSTKKRIYTGENNVDFYFSDPSLDVEPIRPENFQILYNLVQFYTDIFKDFPKDFLEENFTEWLELWLDDVIRLSIKYPLISGFIQILELIVTLMMRLDYNNESVFNQNPSMVRNLESLNFFIKTNIFVRSTQYSGELQVSCLSLIFQLPTPILKNLILEIPPIFITGFTIGRGMLDLAHRALSCFERIIETLSTDPNTKRRVLEQVLPCLESYLSSQDTGDSEVKKMFHGKKTKFVNQQTTTLDTDLMRFKKRILWLLGYFDLDDAQLILSKFEPKLVRNHITNVFRVKLDTNEEKILQIFLDDSVDKICDLALTSSERSIRISACELLHGLAVYMIGKSLDGPDTLPIFPNICRSLIILGADKDETVRQLFEPLLKQIVHFFSRSDKILSPMTTVLIESLMTMISCQSNSSIQDLSAILLNEFLQWMNRQCDRVQRKSSPINLVDLFHSMRKMSLETDASRRMGATMAFNNIYRIIREDEEIVDVYWIYLLEVFATNFKNSEDFGFKLEANFIDGHRYEQISTAMDRIQRVFIEKSSVFHASREKRLQPEGFDGKTLFDVLKWIFFEAAQSEYFYRHKCMEMFLAIVPECGTKEEFFENHLTVEKVLSVGELKHKDLNYLKNFQQQSLFKETWKWMNDLLRSMDYYIWILENEIIPKNLISELLEKSKTLDSLEFFLNEIVLKDLEGTFRSIDPHLIGTSERSMEFRFISQNREEMDLYRCIILVRFIDFITIVCNEVKVGQFLIQNQENLIKVTKQLIFKPQKRGFDYKTKHSILKLPKRLIKFTQKINDESPEEFKLAIMDCLKQSFFKHLTFIAQTFDSIVAERAVGIDNINKLNGIELIFLSGRHNFSYICIDEGLNGVTAETLIVKIFNSLVNKIGEVFRPKHVTPNVQNFMVKIMQLCLKADNFIPKIIELILNNDVLQTSNNCKTFHGDYFLQTFKNTIFGYFIENLLTTTETIIQRYEQDSMKFKIISILTELNAFIFQYHKQNEQLLVKNLNQMKIYWRQIITQSTNMNNEMNCVDLALINLVTHMAMVCPIPLHEFGHSLPELENRIFSILESTQNSLEIKAKAISLLPLVTSINDAENEGLMKVLLSLLSFLPRKSSELKEGSIKLATFISFSKELFKVLLISRSPIIFRFIVIATVSDDKYLLETNLQQVQCELMEDYLDMKGQEIMLATLFKAFSKHNTEIRLSFVTRYLQALMKSAKIDVMLNFFKEQIDGIWRMSELPYANENSSNLINRSIAFLIIEAFYASVPKSKIDSTEFMISGRIMKGNEMTKFFIKNCRDRRKDIFNVDNREAQEMFRKYHCYVYRALATMISNTNTFPEVYDGFLFEENDRFGMIWEKLIDCKNEKLFGEFQQEFEEYPKIRQYITSVRDLKTSGESKNYGNTNSIFDKSLSQSLTKNDLTYSVILTGREMLINDQLQAENEHQKTICINLESTPINDHEVMTVLIGVVNHMFESKISPHHDLQNADMKKFSWVIKLANSITDGKPNVKLFLVKLVDNCRNVFIHYAQYLFLPILRTITDQKLFNKMSFFYTDLVTMLLSWSTVYKPKPTNIQEKDKIVEILIFLIDNHYHEKNEIFRLNLELIKKVCETWKDCLENNLPIFPLFNLMNLENHRIKCGIQVNAVILFNGLIPWRNDTERDQFVNEILKCLQQNDDKIYKPAAQLLGMCLNNNVESERTAVLTDKTIECLNKIRKTTTDINKFLQILYGIQKSYPKILDTFLATIKSSIPSAMRKIKCIYLEMYLSRLENDGDMVYFEIMAFQIKDLLKQNEYQLLSLFIVNKSLEFLKINQAMELVEEMKPLFKSPRDDVRKLLIEVIINVNEKFKNDSNFDRKYLYGILLKGFSDNNIEVQNRIVNFFFNESELPIQTIPRFLMILDDLYVPELEKDFLHYATVFLMEVAIRNPRSKDKLIDYDPTRDQNYTEFKIPTKSSVQQSLAPMFIPSQTRNRSMILATQANDTLQFAPTQDPVQSTQSSQTFELKEAQNTLIFSLKPQYLDSKSNLVSNENITSINYSSEHLNVLESLRKRIVRKNDDEKSRGYAMRAVEKRNFNIDQRKEKLKKLQEGREVQIYRRYRQGDYPDFFFTSLSILLPLKALVMKDPAIARDVFINIFQSLVILVKDDENDVNEKMFFESVNRCVMKILQNTKQNDTFLIATLLDMTMKSEKYLEISPNVLANVVTANNLIVSGILFLENQLKFLIKNKQDIEQQAKRRKLQENSNEDEILTHWLKILDLFYKINEYEIIQGIFAEKLNLIPEVREQLNKAIDFESNSQFKDASEIYKILLEENAPRNYTETDVMLQSYYNCLENLTDWSEISNSIKGHFESYNDIWKESNHHEVLLPHLLKSEVRLILNGKVDATFTQILEDWMNDEEKCNYLRENFPEEIVMLNLVEDKFNEAFVEVEKSLRNCADEWSCLERIDEKMICLKNARILAELNNFTYLMSTNSKEKFQSLLSRIHQSWKNSKAKPADSLVQWRDLTCYREVFHDAIKRIHGENSDNLSNEFSSIDQSLLDLQHSLLDVAFMQKNCDAANFLIKILKQEAENDPIKEKVSKYYLSKSKLILMKTELDFVSPIQRYELLQKGLKTLVSKVLNEERREFKKFPRLFVETYECASDFSWKLCNLLRDNEEFETSQLIALIKRNPTENQTITSHLLAYSEQQLKNARNIAQQFLDRNFSVENELLLAESYFKLGKFYHQAFDSGCDVSSGIQQGIFKSIFRSISYGSIESKIYIPFILNLPDLKNKKLTSDFNNALNLVPIWMFLPYIPQILSNYNFDNESYLDTLLMKIAKKYPNALYFPFKLSLLNYNEMSGNEGMVKIEVREIQEKISNPMLDKFVEALEITVVPEKLFHSEFLKFLTKLTDRMSNRDFGEEYTKFIFNAFEKNLEMKGNEYEKLQKFKKEIEYVKEMKWETERDQIKSQLRKVQKLTEAHLSQSSMRVMRNIETRKLSKFFENYKWNGGNNFIEIPGQYSGDFKPFVEKHVKVVRFGDKMKIFSSKQHPIEMKIHGSDGKTYSFIVKYGEDLRQDQRIQQVLELMSKKLALDKNCKQNRLQIQTYNVIPINSNCGIMSVVNNAITLTEFLDEACHLVIGRTYSSMDYKIRDEFRSFLAADLATTKSSVEIYRHAVKNFSRGELIEELSRQERRINLDVFQQWIMHSSLSFEAHYILRKNLITSLCVMNVAHWILGIGDRHLGNTLINKSNGSLIGIDFGISFDTGVHLEVPELVPCRLTSHFIYVIEPLGIEGIVRRNMIHALRCLRSHKETILICLEMFVKEPTIDWLIRSKQINDPKRKVIWNPEQRIENVKQKLSGANPMKIILDELSFSTIPRDNELHRCYQSLIHGEIDSKRSKMGSYNLSPEDQITAVIEMATDKALLATIWLGWDPWI